MPPETAEEPAQPYATIDRGGVRIHIPRKDGAEISFTLNAENAHALIVSVAKRYAELRTSDGMIGAGADLLAWLLR